MNQSFHDIELLEPIPEKHIYATISVSYWSRPHARTPGYVGHWVLEEQNKVWVYVMRGFHLLKYISDIRPSEQKVKT